MILEYKNQSIINVLKFKNQLSCLEALTQPSLTEETIH